MKGPNSVAEVLAILDGKIAEEARGAASCRGPKEGPARRAHLADAVGLAVARALIALTIEDLVDPLPRKPAIAQMLDERPSSGDRA